MGARDFHRDRTADGDLFGYTSDQKAIRIAKDQLKAHLLAVRLFRDQLPVVMRSYGRILRGTGRYLRLAFMPLLYVIIPITLLIVQLDRYFGWMPLQPAQPFLLTVRVEDPDALNEASLELPPELSSSAPAVHVPPRGKLFGASGWSALETTTSRLQPPGRRCRSRW